MTDEIELVIDDRHDGDRLDRALAQLVDGVSRSSIQKHIDRGAVLIDGIAPPRGAKTKVHAGQEIVYAPPPPERIDLVAEDIPLSILFEDEHFLAVDKPAGMVVHPALGHPNGTLVNAVLHHVQMDVKAGDVRPGIVHRLDRGTTGVIVVAKHVRAHELIADLFRDRKVDKRYLAITKGVPSPPTDTIDTWYGRHPRDRQRFSSKVESGKRAVTEYHVAEVFEGAALVEVKLHTGRTHQIRVHLADRGHGLIGDPVYGSRKKSRYVLDRPALHAHRLAFEHPFTQAPVTLEAPVPADLGILLKQLRSATS